MAREDFPEEAEMGRKNRSQGEEGSEQAFWQREWHVQRTESRVTVITSGWPEHYKKRKAKDRAGEADEDLSCYAQ